MPGHTINQLLTPPPPRPLPSTFLAAARQLNMWKKVLMRAAEHPTPFVPRSGSDWLQCRRAPRFQQTSATGLWATWRKRGTLIYTWCIRWGSLEPETWLAKKSGFYFPVQYVQRTGVIQSFLKTVIKLWWWKCWCTGKVLCCTVKTYYFGDSSS